MQKSTVASLALLGCSVLVTIFFLEIALRLAGISYPLFTKADEWSGFALRPGAAGWVQEEGSAYVRINSRGMRDKERSLEKPENTYRIAVLGDSYTEARQVDQAKTYPAILEQQLAACPALSGQKPEVLNFGVSGFGTTQELLQLREKVWDFQPDLVLLGFTTGNDIRNNSFALEGNQEKPYFHLQGSGLALDLSFRDSPGIKRQLSISSRALQWTLSHSRILQLANKAKRSLTTKAPATAPAPAPTAPGMEAGIDAEMYREPQTPAWKEAWIITEQVLGMMHQETKAHGARFAVATLSNGIQVQPDSAVRKQFQEQLGASDLFYPERRIEGFGMQNGFPVLTLAPLLQRQADEKKIFFHGFPKVGMGTGHWNENGHEAAGTMLAAFLCEKGLVTPYKE